MGALLVYGELGDTARSRWPCPPYPGLKRNETPVWGLALGMARV